MSKGSFAISFAIKSNGRYVLIPSDRISTLHMFISELCLFFSIRDVCFFNVSLDKCLGRRVSFALLPFGFRPRKLINRLYVIINELKYLLSQ